MSLGWEFQIPSSLFRTPEKWMFRGRLTQTKACCLLCISSWQLSTAFTQGVDTGVTYKNQKSKQNNRITNKHKD